MCLRIRTRTIRATANFSSRRNYSSQVLLNYYSVRGARESAYSFFEANCLEHWFKKWEEERRDKLTASTFAAAIGFWPGRRVQLWFEKIGALEPREFRSKEATIWNNIYEEDALKTYGSITDYDVIQPEFQIYGNGSRGEEWLGASPDGIIEDCGVLEIKCPYFYGDAEMTMPWKKIPFYHIPQAQGLMEIMDKDWMDFYVWTPKGSNLFRLYRDGDYWRDLEEALADFWFNHVRPATECSKTDPQYQSKIRSLMPADRHKDYKDIVTESMRIVDKSDLLYHEIRKQS